MKNKRKKKKKTQLICHFGPKQEKTINDIDGIQGIRRYCDGAKKYTHNNVWENKTMIRIEEKQNHRILIWNKEKKKKKTQNINLFNGKWFN